MNKADSDKNTLGFWLYIMTDCVLFACLFATFVVLRNSTAGGPGGADIFSMPLVLTETLLLLFSSFACGMAVINSRSGKLPATLAWLVITFILGAAFLGIEISEFRHLINEGYSFRGSAFLSSFFTLVGTHGAHITAGLTWLGLLAYNLYRKGLTISLKHKLVLFSLFWHFLDLVWIFIFSVVYLVGVA